MRCVNEPNNAAGRFARILDHAVQRRDVLKNHKVFEAWAQLLQIPNHQHRRLINTIYLVHQLPKEIETRVLACAPTEVDQYLAWLPDVQRAMQNNNFSTNFEVPYSPLMSSTTLALVKFCDTLLSSEPEPVVDHTELLGLLDGIESSVREVQQSDLPFHVKAYLTRLLDLAADSIVEYRVIGIRAVAYCADSMYGMHQRDPETWESAKTTDVGNRVWEILGKYSTIVTVADSVVRFGSVVQKFLPQ